jgi:putative two-component system response regulator
LQARVRTHLSLRELQLALLDHNRCLEEMVEAQFHDILAAKEELSQAQIATITALSKLAESRDDHTGKHIERVQTYCRMVAMEIALRPAYRAVVTSAYIETLAQASPLHDIGKVGIADAILLKPGKLTPDEMAIMQSHTTIGAETLRRVVAQYPGNSFINIGIEIAGSHHERWDGKGYPEGLSGEGIPLSARITALADVYDALRSARTYKPAFSREDSRRIVADGGGTQFDPVLVEVFLAAEPDMYEASILLAS